MKIQSLSIVVPNKGCMNSCPFCVSRMHESIYKNQLYGNIRFFDLYSEQYMNAMQFARDNGCNTVMLTGDSEPQQNRTFLKDFGFFNKMIANPFKIIEIQTTGAGIHDETLRFLRNWVGVSCISLSISSFDDKKNNEIIHSNIKSDSEFWIDLKYLCSEIKRYDFTLRLSLNMNDFLLPPNNNFEEITKKAKELGADQLTLRKMYTSGDGSQAEWVRKYAGSVKYTNWFNGVDKIVREKGRYLETLEFGALRYSYEGMSTVIDTDCMSTEGKESLKYLILREDCKLYSKWDDPASLVY